MMRIFISIMAALLISLPSTGQKTPGNYLCGRALMSKADYDSAMYFLDRAVKENAGDFDARFFRGMVHFKQGDFPAALKDFLTVDRRYPGRASLMLAKTELRLNHTQLALKYLEQHLSSSYKLAEKEILLDPELSSLEDHPGWKKLWREKDWYTDFEKEFQEAVYLKNSGSELEALNLLRNLEKQGIDKTKVHFAMAEIYYNTGNSRAALNELEASLGSDSRNQEALKLRIRIGLDNGSYEQVARDCGTLLRQDPAAFRYYLVRGDAMGKLGRYQEGVNDFDLYLDLFPADDSAYYRKALMQQSVGKYLDALASVNRALEIATGHAGYFSTRGELYAATKLHRYAVRDFSMALDLDPHDADTWYQKGLSELELGETKTACFDFRVAARQGNYEAVEQVRDLCGGQ